MVCCSAVFETGSSYIALAGWLDWNSNICFLSVGLKVWAVGPIFFSLSFFVFVALGVELIHLCLLDKCFLYSELHPKPKTVAVLYTFL